MRLMRAPSDAPRLILWITVFFGLTGAQAWAQSTSGHEALPADALSEALVELKQAILDAQGGEPQDVDAMRDADRAGERLAALAAGHFKRETKAESPTPRDAEYAWLDQLEIAVRPDRVDAKFGVSAKRMHAFCELVGLPPQGKSSRAPDCPICTPVRVIDAKDDAFTVLLKRASERTFGDEFMKFAYSTDLVLKNRGESVFSPRAELPSCSDDFQKKVQELSHRMQKKMKRHPKFRKIRFGDPDGLSRLDAEERRHFSDWILRETFRESASLVSAETGKRDSGKKRRNKGSESFIEDAILISDEIALGFFERMSGWLPGEIRGKAESIFNAPRMIVTWTPVGSLPLDVEYQRQHGYSGEKRDERLRAVLRLNGGWNSADRSPQRSTFQLAAESVWAEDRQDWRVIVQFATDF